MKQTVVLQLEPTPAQYRALLSMMESFNLACQYIADIAYENRLANKTALQPMVSADLQKRFGLSSQMAIRALTKAMEAYRRDKRVHVRFDPHAPMLFDPRILSFKGLTDVSLLGPSGRLLVPMRFVRYEAAQPLRLIGQADLAFENGVFFLYAYVNLPSLPDGM